MRPKITIKILSVALCTGAVMALMGFSARNAVQAQTIGDPTPIENNGVTEAARSAANAAAFGKPGAKLSAKDRAQRDVVFDLIPQYTQCKSDARAAVRSRGNANRERYKAAESVCTQRYNPQFGRACVGAANAIAICQRFKSRGTLN